MPRFPVYNAGVKPALLFALACALPAADLRIGIVGTDTSHVPAFTKMLHDEALGAKVVAAWKGGSPDLPQSANRVEQYAEELRTKYGVEIVPDLARAVRQGGRGDARERGQPRPPGAGAPDHRRREALLHR